MRDRTAQQAVLDRARIDPSVQAQGEDVDRYAGGPRLVRATGHEPFDTTAGGETVVEHPDAGEVVWCTDAGVTGRRWNGRPTGRTQLTDGTPP